MKQFINIPDDYTLSNPAVGETVLTPVKWCCNTHWVGAKVHVTRCVDLYSGQILVFSMTLMTVCVLSAV